MFDAPFEFFHGEHSFETEIVGELPKRLGVGGTEDSRGELEEHMGRQREKGAVWWGVWGSGFMV